MYMCRLTIRIRSDDAIRPNTKTLFGPLFVTKANIWYIPINNPHLALLWLTMARKVSK